MSANRGKGADACRSTCRLCLALSWCLLLAVAGLLLLAGCDRGTQTPASETPTAAPTSDASPAPKSTATASASPVTATPSVSLTLTIWGPDFMAPLDEVTGGPVLAAQMRAYEEAHPGQAVTYVRKKPYGQGGLVHFLRSTEAVAPDQLPDLALVDMRELGLLADDSLPQPLDSVLPKELTSDLMPFAHTAGLVGDQLLALQYDADLRFLAYNSSVISQPPSTWAEVLAADVSYLLPIGATEGAVCDAFLPQYLALGGKLVDRDGHPYLDKTLVEAILDVYKSAYDAGLFPAAGFDLEDASDCWPVYLTSRAGMTNVNSWDYGRDRADRLAATQVGPLPTLSGATISLSDGWGWVLLTKDPAHQAAALQFLSQIFQPDAMAAWSQATYHLPTRESALKLAVTDSGYRDFLESLVPATVPEPREPVYSLATTALSQAIEDVTRGRTTPRMAAADAAERVSTMQQEPTPSSQY